MQTLDSEEQTSVGFRKTQLQKDNPNDCLPFTFYRCIHLITLLINLAI